MCWGSNEHGQTDAPELSDVTQVGAGADYSCALTKDQTLHCWGAALPEAMPELGDITSFSAFAKHVCTVTAERVLCWHPELGPRLELIRE